MEVLSLYAIPSISAVSIKLLILYFGWKSLKESVYWIWLFFGGLFGLNLFECLNFLIPFNDQNYNFSMVLLKGYYLSAIITCLSYLALSINISASKPKIFDKALIFAVCAAMLATLAPGFTIKGIESIGYSITRVAGPGYWLIQLVLLVSLLLAVSILAYNSIYSKKWFSRSKSKALLIGTTPSVLCVLGVLSLMSLGYKINGSVIISLSINFLLITLVIIESETNLFRFMSFIPATNESRLLNKSTEFLFSLESKGLQKVVSQFEQALILDALSQRKNDKSDTAKFLNISRSTLNRKLIVDD